MNTVKARLTGTNMQGAGMYPQPGAPQSAEMAQVNFQVIPDDKAEGFFKGAAAFGFSVTVPLSAVGDVPAIGSLVTISIEEA